MVRVHEGEFDFLTRCDRIYCSGFIVAILERERYHYYRWRTMGKKPRIESFDENKHTFKNYVQELRELESADYVYEKYKHLRHASPKQKKGVKKEIKRSQKKKVIDWLITRMGYLKAEKKICKKNPDNFKKNRMEEIIRDIKTLQATLRAVQKNC